MRIECREDNKDHRHQNLTYTLKQKKNFVFFFRCGLIAFRLHLCPDDIRYDQHDEEDQTRNAESEFIRPVTDFIKGERTQLDTAEAYTVSVVFLKPVDHVPQIGWFGVEASVDAHDLTASTPFICGYEIGGHA